MIDVDKLVQRGEVALRFGVTIRAVDQWLDRFDGAPDPVQMFITGPAWDWDDWRAWGIQTGRLDKQGQPVRLKGGRPRIHPVQS
jgi:hypothetical protein